MAAEADLILPKCLGYKRNPTGGDDIVSATGAGNEDGISSGAIIGQTAEPNVEHLFVDVEDEVSRSDSKYSFTDSNATCFVFDCDSYLTSTSARSMRFSRKHPGEAGQHFKVVAFGVDLEIANAINRMLEAQNSIASLHLNDFAARSPDCGSSVVTRLSVGRRGSTIIET